MTGIFYLVQTIGYKTDKQDVSCITKKVKLVTDHPPMVQEWTADIHIQQWWRTSSLMSPIQHEYIYNWHRQN